MRWLLAIALLASCDYVYSLDRPAPTQFCLQPANAAARFCEDFDATDGAEPLAAFDLPDSADRYTVDEAAAHSAPLGALLTLSGTGSLDARLQRLLDVDTAFEASIWGRIARLEQPAVDNVKMIALHFGELTNGVFERVIYLTSEGNLTQKIGMTFPRIVQVDAFSLDRWFHVGLAVDLVTSTGRLTVDDEITQFEFMPLNAPSSETPVMMTIGPHDPQPNMMVEVQMHYDDIVVTDEP